jgi:hypothetical protein
MPFTAIAHVAEGACFDVLLMLEADSTLICLICIRITIVSMME